MSQQRPNVVPGTEASNVDPASLIPAAHLPAAAETIGNRTQGGKSNPRDMQLLNSLQAQLNTLMGNASGASYTDLIMVNPHGRIVEISGDMVEEHLAKPGFRKATSEEEANYRRAIIRQTPEYLRRREKKRLQEQAELLDSIEEEDANEDVSTESLLRAPIADGQLTGAPLARTQPKPPSQPATPPAPKAGEGDSTDEDDETSNPKPRSRSRGKK
jgi:hypothetical protein